MLEILKNIRLLLLYLGFDPKKKIKTLMRMKETLNYFGYSYKKKKKNTNI